MTRRSGKARGQGDMSTKEELKVELAPGRCQATEGLLMT